MNGRFIVIEGPDGAGKSTQARMLIEALTEAGGDPLLIREPGGTLVGEAIRTLLLDPKAEIEPRSELLLYMAARAQLCREVIGPALSAGRDVISDRFLASSAAYQGKALDLGMENVMTIGSFATDGIHPDITVILDIDLVESKARRAGDTPDRIEQRDDTFHQNVRDGYLEYAKTYPEGVTVIDGTEDVDAVHRKIMETVEHHARI